MQRRTPQQPGWMVELTAAVDIPVETIQWIWPGWLPRGKLSILAGAGGCGKTTLSISLAALSRGGDWPDGSKSETASNVVIWSGEDGIGDTIIPRLTAADADLTWVRQDVVVSVLWNSIPMPPGTPVTLYHLYGQPLVLAPDGKFMGLLNRPLNPRHIGLVRASVSQNLAFLNISYLGPNDLWAN